MIFETVDGERPEEEDGERAERRIHPARFEERRLYLVVDQRCDADDEVEGEQAREQAADEEGFRDHLFTPTLQCPVPPSQGPYGHHMQE